MARNFALLRANAGSEIVFFKHSIFKKFKNEIKLKNTFSVKKISLSKIHPIVGFLRKRLVLAEDIQ